MTSTWAVSVSGGWRSFGHSEGDLARPRGALLTPAGRFTTVQKMKETDHGKYTEYKNEKDLIATTA